MGYHLEGPGAVDLQSLAKLSLFGRVDLDKLEPLISDCEVRAFSPGEIVIRREQANDCMYVILHGHLSIHLFEAEDAIAVLREGDTVGEMSVVGEQTTSALVKADTHAELLIITQNILWKLVEKDLEFARNLLQLFAKRLLNITNMVYFSRKLQQEYKQQAHTDVLTGLYNRRWLTESLPYEMSRCAVRNRPLALLAIDIDQFSRYHRQYGHGAGDQLLMGVSNALAIVLRRLDMAVRYDGTQIITVLPGADVNESEQIANRVHQSIKQIKVKQKNGDALPGVTLSIGVAEMGEEDYSEMLIARAYAALERAKNSGGNGTSR
jgi:diguanylate cyclase (GGDEF)-like protein